MNLEEEKTNVKADLMKDVLMRPEISLTYEQPAGEAHLFFTSCLVSNSKQGIEASIQDCCI